MMTSLFAGCGPFWATCLLLIEQYSNRTRNTLVCRNTGVVCVRVGYEWPGWALDALRGIEPQEVMQALGATRRWPRAASSDVGLRLITIWARTRRGRPLIVAVRQIGEWDWEIIGARDLRPQELTDFEQWEASHE